MLTLSLPTVHVQGAIVVEAEPVETENITNHYGLREEPLGIVVELDFSFPGTIE
jgi:hypothetical protein